jgi:hypothetical protein
MDVELGYAPDFELLKVKLKKHLVEQLSIQLYDVEK